jgi:UDP-galactopyranose mutase
MSFHTATVLITGAGFSGATLARILAENGFRCVVVDERQHVAGNCHTERDHKTGIMVHRYGPHIFHTDDDRIWKFVCRFGEFVPYRHQVFTTAGGNIFSLPINLHTINQFFGKTFTPDEARRFIASKTVHISDPKTLEEQALSTLGPELYHAFIRDYTAKQWGRDPKTLPAAVLKRLPVRFDYDTNYFRHSRQMMPRDGYSDVVASMLRHSNIEVRLGEAVEGSRVTGTYAHVFYTGMLDRYFDFRLGRLGYRTLDFEELRTERALQGTAVMNFGDLSVPWTRATEFRYLTPWEVSAGEESVSYREYVRDCWPDDIPYYPIHLSDEHALLRSYVALAETQQGVTFLGRLGSFAYLDMDVAIGRAMDVAECAVAALRSASAPPVFVHRPL